MRFFALCFGVIGIALGMPEPSPDLVIEVSQIIGRSIKDLPIESLEEHEDSTTSSPTTEDSTTPALTTEGSTTAVVIPAGFELYYGRVIRRPKNTDSMSTYDVSMNYCNNFDARPFIPRTVEDYTLYKEVRLSLGSYGEMWLPANDRESEGTLRWYTNEIDSDITRWQWRNGKTLENNSASMNCLVYAIISSTLEEGKGVQMNDCASTLYLPPICEKN